MLEPPRPTRALVRGRRRPCSRWPALLGAGAAAGRAALARRAPRVALVGARARPPRRRRRRRAAAARQLGRAGRRHRRAASTRCPGARVPYRGLDEWTRIVIPLGGTRAGRGSPRCWRSGRGAAAIGFPLAALIAARDALRGARRGARLRGRVPARRAAGAARARLPAARAPAADARPRGAARARRRRRVAALIVAPALDARRAVVGLRDVGALDRRARSRPRFSWDHDYGPLDWPRDGRELLRVKARSAAYWKAREPRRLRRPALARRRARARARRSIRAARPTRRVRDRWTQHDQGHACATCARARSSTAGIAVDAPRMPHRAAIPNGPPGIWSSSRTLRRGDTYTVDVYMPQPTARELRGRRDGLRPRPRPPTATIQLDEPPSRRSATRPGRRRRRDTSRSGTSAPCRVEAVRPDPGPAAPSTSTRPRARAAPACGAPGRSRSGSSAARDAVRRTSRRSRATSAAASATPSRRRRRRGRSTASCSTPSRATASSSRARWRCCCAWAASRRAWHRLHGRLARPQGQGVRRARPRRPLLGRGVVPGHRLGHLRPDARPPRRRARRPTRAAPPAIGDAPDLGGGGALDPRAGRRARPERTPWG